MLYRTVKKDINAWINNKNDALLVTGARQIGKTYTIRECLNENGCSYVEFNFIEQPELIDLFNNAKTIEDLLMRISLVSDKKLIKGETIIFFDEVQEVKDIVTKIKFLVDEGSYKYVLSGSLLGVELGDLRSAPVGYLEVIDMYPLGIEEFMLSLGVNKDIINKLKESFNKKEPVDKFIHEKLIDIFYLYLIIGGMPEVIDTYLKSNNLDDVSQVHKKIIRLYKMDFTKYEKIYKLKLIEIYDSIPSQLNNQNKRFLINKIENSISFERNENNFLWLKDAGVALPIYNITEPKLPLMISEKRNLFKLFLSDVGLLTSFYSNEVKIAILNKDKNINNGALFENVVAQELKLHNVGSYYYNSKRFGELDFVVELDGQVVPLEIKSGKDYKNHSALCNVLKQEDFGINYAYIFNNDNLRVDNKKIYLPIYMLMFVENKKLSNPNYTIDISKLK